MFGATITWDTGNAEGDGYNITMIDKYVDQDADDPLQSVLDLTMFRLVGSDTVAGDYFGSSGAINGNYVIVGANRENENGSLAGAAYIFNKSVSWDSGVKILGSDTDSEDQFGYSVAINGDYVVIGANYKSETVSYGGAAYVFHRTGTNTWDGGTKIVSNDLVDGDYFGYSLGISGDYIVVGALLENENGTNAGAGYLFNRTGTNTWDGGTKIVSNNIEAQDKFGTVAAIESGNIVFGAVGENSSAGAIYVTQV